MHTATRGDRLVGAYAWVIVGLRALIPVAWLAAAVLASIFLPGLGGSGQSPLGDIVPSSSPAVAAEQQALRLFGSTVLTDTVVVQRNPRGLSTDQVARLVSGTRDVARHRLPGDLAGIRAAVPLVNVPVPGVRWGSGAPPR